MYRYVYSNQFNISLINCFYRFTCNKLEHKFIVHVKVLSDLAVTVKSLRVKANYDWIHYKNI